MHSTHQDVTVLVIDDEAIIRQSFQDQLEDLGYQVVTAENGLIGLEAILQSSPQLVLTDLRMPEMDGLELIRRCQEVAPDIPIIVISGAGVIGDAVEALRLGAYDYLIKPVDGPDILDHTLEQALENARLVQENQAYQEHLETLVRERTRDLDEANAHLEDINGRLRRIVETTQGFSACIDVSSISTRILNEFADHMCASGGSLYFIEESGLRRVHVLDEGHADEFIPFPLARHSIFRQVIESGKPLLIEDIAGLPNTASSGWGGYRDGSLLTFPLPRESGEILGLLTLHTKDKPPFVEEDKEIGAILASYSCEAIRSISATETLRESEQRFRELADMLPLTVCEMDTDGLLTYSNRQARLAFGYRDDELAGLTIYDMVSPDERDKIAVDAALVMRNRRDNSNGNEYGARRKDGTVFPVLTYSAPILRKGQVVGVRTAAVDISLLKQQQEQILWHAHFDSLTGLPNRFLVLDRLEQLLKEAKRTGKLVAVLFLDLDDFKKINDTLGHEAGDQLLVQAATRLDESLRDGDTVGRLGGDEFVVLLGGLSDVEDARPVAMGILERFRQIFLLEGRDLLLTTSLGIAIYPVDGLTPTELLRNADSAMYYSKEQGRNTYHYFTDGMNKDAARRLLLEEHLHGALERNELYVHYQPLIDIRRREVVGAEALLRWKSPALGQVAPDEFIPILEQNGQIVPVGRHALSVALQLAVQWQKPGPFKIAVNLSPRQFRDPTLLTFVEDLLGSTGLSGESLELEITEGVLMTANALVDDTLTNLSKLGVSISMDDFGTGYSSLSYLRNYPFNTLKIDRSFINDIATNDADRELVGAAITMGHSLGLGVVAEGVETEEQLAILKQLDCELAQGYLFSRPIPADSVPDLIAEFSGRAVNPNLANLGSE